MQDMCTDMCIDMRNSRHVFSGHVSRRHAYSRHMYRRVFRRVYGVCVDM